MRKILIVLILLVAGTAAGQSVDIPCVSDTTLSLTSGWYEVAKRSFDVATNGNASITFLWLDIANEDRATVKKSQMYFLRSAYPPRSLYFAGSGPDSATVDVVTATEIILTVTP